MDKKFAKTVPKNAKISQNLIMDILPWPNNTYKKTFHFYETFKNTKILVNLYMKFQASTLIDIFRDCQLGTLQYYHRTRQ